MMIQLTDRKGKDLYVNVDNLLFFREDTTDGGTYITMASSTDYHTLCVQEDPYKVFARIRAEERTARTPITRSYDTGPG